MDNDEKWEEPLEENGLTLGPEEYLQREIEKSKSLKVDRLRLKDEIEQLKAQKEELKEKNYQLQQRIEELNNSIPSSESLKNDLAVKKNFWGLLIIATLFLSILLLFFRNWNLKRNILNPLEIPWKVFLIRSEGNPMDI